MCSAHALLAPPCPSPTPFYIHVTHNPASFWAHLCVSDMIHEGLQVGRWVTWGRGRWVVGRFGASCDGWLSWGVGVEHQPLDKSSPGLHGDLNRMDCPWQQAPSLIPAAGILSAGAAAAPHLPQACSPLTLQNAQAVPAHMCSTYAAALPHMYQAAVPTPTVSGCNTSVYRQASDEYTFTPFSAPAA